jgi:hypothetical protein
MKKIIKPGRPKGTGTSGGRESPEEVDFLEKTKFAVDVFRRVCYIKTKKCA